MSKITYISTSEIRKDLVGFFKRLEPGKEVVVLNRSKPVVSIRNAASAYPRKSSKEMLKIAQKIRSQAKGSLDPDKSIKDLYWEAMAKKYDIR